MEKEKIVEKTIVVEKEVKGSGNPVVVQEDKVREGLDYLYGICKPKNFSEALRIFTQEATKNPANAVACNILGKLYYEGEFVKQNLEESYKWYKISEERDNEEGLYRIGLTLEEGKYLGKEFKNLNRK